MEILEIENKIKYILLEVSKNNPNEDYLVRILTHARFSFTKHGDSYSFPNTYDLEIKTTPEVFTRHFSLKNSAEKIIKHRINESTKLDIYSVFILPDYTKLELVNSQVTPIFTEWDEINQLQQQLIENLQRASNSTDFQNIGNAGRIIMDKVSRQVFDSVKHKPTDSTKLVHDGKFKNQLHSYINSVLSGNSNTEFRKLANSSIDFVENACDLMSTTTHKLNAEKHLAEVCVISTLSAISIINLIRQLE